MFSQQHPFTLFEAHNEVCMQDLTHRLYTVPSKKAFTNKHTASANDQKAKSLHVPRKLIK